MDERITCRIWARENTKGRYHRCHAEHNGLAGQAYYRGEIKQKLETTPIDIPGTGGVWELLACEPNHDGRACDRCPYKSYKGLSHFYDLTKQREALMAAKGRGANIRIIE
jgi:hypothetical protein